MLLVILTVVVGVWLFSWLLPLLAVGVVVHEVVPKAYDLEPKKETFKTKVKTKTNQAKDFYTLWKEEVDFATGKRKVPVPEQEYVEYWNKYYNQK